MNAFCHAGRSIASTSALSSANPGIRETEAEGNMRRTDASGDSETAAMGSGLVNGDSDMCLFRRESER
jgi:hypothetical protein